MWTSSSARKNSIARPDYLDEILAGQRDKIVDVEAEAGSEATIREHLPHGRWAGNGHAAPVTAFVSIMQGCNQHCTFCIVPYTRGEERSRTIPDIVAECRQLVEGGVKEITLLGQIVTSYGKRDLPAKDGKSGFVQLLEAVHEIDGLERIRFTSPHPKGYGDDLVEAYGRLPKLCESAHLPAQSGSDRILKAMHRGYTRERFLGIVGKLRRVQPAHRHHHRHHRRFSGRDGGGFRGDAVAGARGAIRQRLPFQVLAAQGHAGRGDARPGAGTR